MVIFILLLAEKCGHHSTLRRRLVSLEEVSSIMTEVWGYTHTGTTALFLWHLSEALHSLEITQKLDWIQESCSNVNTTWGSLRSFTLKRLKYKEPKIDLMIKKTKKNEKRLLTMMWKWGRGQKDVNI